MLPKKGIVFPNGENLGPYAMVKNWLAGVSGPNGQHLVELIRNSDEVLDVLLLLAGRQQVAAAKKLVDVRNKLAETIQQVDELMGEGRPKA